MDTIRAADKVKVQPYVEAYIAADRLMVDDVKSKILERIVVYHQTRYVDPDLIARLSEANHHGSALHAFLVAQLAWDFEACTKVFGSGSQSNIDEGGMSRTDLCRLLFAMNVMKGCKNPSWWASG